MFRLYEFKQGLDPSKGLRPCRFVTKQGFPLARDRDNMPLGAVFWCRSLVCRGVVYGDPIGS
jgi:hypothetical protein